MMIYKLNFDNIITKEDLNNGNLILFASRPGVGKTQTCIELIKSFKDNYDFIYFDLSVGGTNFWQSQSLKIKTDYKSSLEIIRSIEKFVKKENAKFVIIDYWQVVENQGEWFLRKLLEFSWEHKLIIIITSQLERLVEKRKNHLPKFKDFRNVKNIFKFARKIIVIERPAMYGLDVEDELKYYVYKDVENSYITQE